MKLFADPETDTELEETKVKLEPSAPTPSVKGIDGKSSTAPMSLALPFTPTPSHLSKKKVPGNFGFDPLNFSASEGTLDYMRDAEIKHGRLAMLACVGWPFAEIFDAKIAGFLGLPVLLNKYGESPSILNGGLDRINPFYWLLVISLAGLVEYDITELKKDPKTYTPGNVGYDILSLLPKDKEGEFKRREQEVKHGRLAMGAIVGYAVQEAVYHVPVLEEKIFGIF
ncbi:hypothetical protein TrVE_jg8140 [Triparma verrucosa]|uniref:Chlorophyll a-b binding protein, chloroplastic n=2 Tax=Triparma TaxID=722752 RepID=A0A9W7BQQ1_9STRA|nr:hypothetical protein TrST_g13840 [Triparma strigata]GMH96573.1 hypothetical protein TrVE_jg8140 [Triparma verrucosa]